MMNNVYSVGIGEIKVSRNPTVLTCMGLGSCVALFLIDGVARVGGVAHIMLPDSNQARPQSRGDGGQFANEAPKLLLRRLTNLGADESQVVAKIVGGANMFSSYQTGMLSELGERTVEIVRAELAALNIPLVGEDVGGHRGRSARFNLETGSVKIKTVFGEEKDI
ncbi:chemotaxis protein CheD [Acidobacteria bacterium AH-259-A15]|nr:chemotaxis protein CheD [Acidobacteria bacterium AH-259-A15]